MRNKLLFRMYSGKLTENNVNNRMLRKVRYFQECEYEDMCSSGM